MIHLIGRRERKETDLHDSVRNVTVVETLRGLEVRYGEVRVGTIAHVDASGTYAFRPDPNGPLAGTPVTRSFDAYALLRVAEDRLSGVERSSGEPELAEPGLTRRRTRFPRSSGSARRGLRRRSARLTACAPRNEDCQSRPKRAEGGSVA